VKQSLKPQIRRIRLGKKDKKMAEEKVKRKIKENMKCCFLQFEVNCASPFVPISL